jgi:hypothetical protein
MPLLLRSSECTGEDDIVGGLFFDRRERWLRTGSATLLRHGDWPRCAELI